MKIGLQITIANGDAQRKEKLSFIVKKIVAGTLTVAQERKERIASMSVVELIW